MNFTLSNLKTENIYNCFASLCPRPVNSIGHTQDYVFDKFKFHNRFQMNNINQDQMPFKQDIFNQIQSVLIMELIKERLQLGQSMSHIFPTEANHTTGNSLIKSQVHSTDSDKTKNVSVKKKNGKVVDFVQYLGSDGKPVFKQKRAKRGQYRKYEQDQLNCAMNAVLTGSMSVHKAGSRFGVPHSTLEYKVKEKQGFQFPGNDLAGCSSGTVYADDDKYIKDFGYFPSTDLLNR